MSAVPKWFLRRLQILESLKFAPATMDMHWLALKDVAEADLQHAVKRAARECDEFPSPKMLRAFITEQRSQYETRGPAHDPARETPVTAKSFTVPNVEKPITVQREWKYFCDDCHDSGWLTHWCGPDSSPRPWVTRRTCDRRHEHGSHEWVRLCPCAVSNPDVPVAVKQRAKAQAGA